MYARGEISLARLNAALEAYPPLYAAVPSCVKSKPAASPPASSSDESSQSSKRKRMAALELGSDSESDPEQPAAKYARGLDPVSAPAAEAVEDHEIEDAREHCPSPLAESVPELEGFVGLDEPEAAALPESDSGSEPLQLPLPPPSPPPAPRPLPPAKRGRGRPRKIRRGRKPAPPPPPPQPRPPSVEPDEDLEANNAPKRCTSPVYASGSEHESEPEPEPEPEFDPERCTSPVYASGSEPDSEPDPEPEAADPDEFGSASDSPSPAPQLSVKRGRGRPRKDQRPMTIQERMAHEQEKHKDKAHATSRRRTKTAPILHRIQGATMNSAGYRGDLGPLEDFVYNALVRGFFHYHSPGMIHIFQYTWTPSPKFKGWPLGELRIPLVAISEFITESDPAMCYSGRSIKWMLGRIGTFGKGNLNYLPVPGCNRIGLAKWQHCLLLPPLAEARARWDAFKKIQYNAAAWARKEAAANAAAEIRGRAAAAAAAATLD